jgi:hypothetical protein
MKIRRVRLTVVLLPPCPLGQQARLPWFRGWSRSYLPGGPALALRRLGRTIAPPLENDLWSPTVNVASTNRQRMNNRQWALSFRKENRDFKKSANAGLHQGRKRSAPDGRHKGITRSSRFGH